MTDSTDNSTDLDNRCRQALQYLNSKQGTRTPSTAYYTGKILDSYKEDHIAADTLDWLLGTITLEQFESWCIQETGSITKRTYQIDDHQRIFYNISKLPEYSNMQRALDIDPSKLNDLIYAEEDPRTDKE